MPAIYLSWEVRNVFRFRKNRSDIHGLRGKFGAALGRFVKARSGVAAIEFALTMPVLIMLLAGSINFGHVIYVQHTMQAVAGEALRSVAYGQLDLNDAATFAKSQLPRLKKGTVNWDVRFVENPGTNQITIMIEVPSEAASLMPLPYVSASTFTEKLRVELVAPRITPFDPA